MIRALVFAAIGGTATVFASGPAEACPGRERPCEIDGGQYYALLPEEEARGAVLFLHGFRSNAGSILRNAALVDGVLGRGYALIVPNGSDDDGVDGGSWAFAEMVAASRPRNDDTFLPAVAEDAAQRFGLNRDRMILGGFSEGGFMTTYLACRRPETFAAYTPVAGGFWRPAPDSCAGPVRLFHTHGWRDEVVPLEGRWLRRPNYAQADIFGGLEILRDANSCEDFKPQRLETNGAFLRRGWDCAAGSALEFALFDGGHRVPQGWADMVLDWFETLP